MDGHWNAAGELRKLFDFPPLMATQESPPIGPCVSIVLIDLYANDRHSIDVSTAFMWRLVPIYHIVTALASGRSSFAMAHARVP